MPICPWGVHCILAWRPRGGDGLAHSNAICLFLSSGIYICVQVTRRVKAAVLPHHKEVGWLVVHRQKARIVLLSLGSRAIGIPLS